MPRFKPAPGRANLIAQLEGSDPSAPTLILMGHTDVVPVNPERWRDDPFGGELINGEVWGRGAIDMLNLTASMAVATKELGRTGFKPKGTLIYFAVADEEAGGAHGAGWVTDHEYDAVKADYVLTESGGVHPARVWETCAELAVTDQRLAKFAHACTHMTFSPNVVHGGVKTNVIPDVVDIDVDIRTLPGESDPEVDANLREALGPDLAG